MEDLSVGCFPAIVLIHNAENTELSPSLTGKPNMKKKGSDKKLQLSDDVKEMRCENRTGAGSIDEAHTRYLTNMTDVAMKYY